MPHADFVHLHNHTQYSLLDGMVFIPDFVHLARQMNMSALAITDHGNMFGAIEFYKACLNCGLKPIIGTEAYIAPDSRFEKSSHGIQDASFHLILLARDEVGYKNLMKLVSIGYLEGFYYRPRIDKEVLAKHSEGLIGLSSCLKGEIPHLASTGREVEAGRVAEEFKGLFAKGDFYLELMDNGMPEQYKVNESLVAIARKCGLPIVATNDIHYLNRQNAASHEILLCIQTQTTIEDPNRMRFQTDQFYFKSPSEMKDSFLDYPEAIRNTLEITEKCNLELSFGEVHLPHFTPPEGSTREAYLRQLCEEGLKTRYKQITEETKARLEHEIALVKRAGYISYFLIVRDFIKFAKDKGIPVGPGRGSAAGSLISYCLGITDIDPLQYDLLFERFLNPERVGLPDIDIDFCFERRGEVIDYVIKKYGKENVAQIITFGTMQARAAIRDVGRVLNMSYPEVDRIAKLVPFDPNITLKKAIENEPELNTSYKTDAQITRLLDISMEFEGLLRHASTHAAGVVITEQPLTSYMPLFKTSDDQITTGYAMDALEEIGLLKMDFLGLKTLTVIDETIKIVKRTRSIEVEVDSILLNDERTYRLLQKAESLGVFQLESPGMRDLLRRMKPERFEDLIALLALYRPGPIGSGMIDDFIKRKGGQVPIRYDHRLLEPILKETYGAIIYQEQVMRIASALAGFSLSEADSLRRAMSKKTPEVMAEARERFIGGAIKSHKIERRIAEEIFNHIEYFAGYGFNRSHSAAYALISYRTAYLKANYPVEFMTALLSSERDNTDKLVEYIKECNRMGIRILPPDVNESFSKFTTIDSGTIRFGLSAVKNVGRGAVDAIIRSRLEEGSFKSLYEFCERVDLRLVNRKVLESLIKCGAFDSLGFFRSQLFATLDKAIEAAGGVYRDRQIGQRSFFEAFESNEGFKQTFYDVPAIKEWPEHQMLAFEKEMLGFFITGHPLASYERLLRSFVSRSTANLGLCRDGEELSIGGLITKAKQTQTKKTNERMAILSLEDLEGSCEVLVFPKAYSSCAQFIRLNSVVFVKGRISLRDESPKIIANELLPLGDAKKKLTASVHIDLLAKGSDDGLLKQISALLLRFPGEVPVYFDLMTSTGEAVQIQAGADYAVSPTDEFERALGELLGEGALRFSLTA